MKNTASPDPRGSLFRVPRMDRATKSPGGLRGPFPFVYIPVIVAITWTDKFLEFRIDHRICNKQGISVHQHSLLLVIIARKKRLHVPLHLGQQIILKFFSPVIYRLEKITCIPSPGFLAAFFRFARIVSFTSSKVVACPNDALNAL
jgi:hypothetical protein